MRYSFLQFELLYQPGKTPGFYGIMYLGPWQMRRRNCEGPRCIGKGEDNTNSAVASWSLMKWKLNLIGVYVRCAYMANNDLSYWKGFEETWSVLPRQAGGGEEVWGERRGRGRWGRGWGGQWWWGGWGKIWGERLGKHHNITFCKTIFTFFQFSNSVASNIDQRE